MAKKKAQKAKKLVRSTSERMVAGVAGGLAEYFEIDPSIVRLAWLVIFFMGGSGFFVYLLAWALIPEKGKKSSTSSVSLLVLILLAILIVSMFRGMNWWHGGWRY